METSSSATPLSQQIDSLCIDSSGLCVGKKGDSIDESHSGTFKSILNLASMLGHTGEIVGSSAPMVTIETESSAYLVKEFDGHTLVLKVPVEDESQGGEMAEEPAVDDDSHQADE